MRESLHTYIFIDIFALENQTLLSVYIAPIIAPALHPTILSILISALCKTHKTPICANLFIPSEERTRLTFGK